MSQPSRADRRRNERGGAQPPRKRDPMTFVYGGLVVLVVLIFLGFWLFNLNQQHQYAAAVATPTPGPVASSKPVQLHDGDKLGTPMFGVTDPKKGADTMLGGHGSTVDGVGCESMEGAALHIHTHLSIFVNGKQAQVPNMIGMTPTASGGCLYWIHTHSQDGIIHLETPQIKNPQTGGDYTLGMFFDIWGMPVTRNNIGQFKGPVTAFVNGSKYDGDIRDIPLQSHEIVTLEVGTPVVPPKNYVLPPND
jgi:hypothetical protein